MANDLKTTGYVGPITQVNASRAPDRRKGGAKRAPKRQQDESSDANNPPRPRKIDDYA